MLTQWWRYCNIFFYVDTITVLVIFFYADMMMSVFAILFYVDTIMTVFVIFFMLTWWWRICNIVLCWHDDDGICNIVLCWHDDDGICNIVLCWHDDDGICNRLSILWKFYSLEIMKGLVCLMSSLRCTQYKICQWPHRRSLVSTTNKIKC